MGKRYQSDEPDGKSNALNSTGIAYNTIKELDPYHPLSLALNCYDFYYSDYAAGADIIVPGVCCSFMMLGAFASPSQSALLTGRSHRRIPNIHQHELFDRL